MIVKGNSNSFLVFNKENKFDLGWDANPIVGHIISCTMLRDEELHTFWGMVGYCMKDNGENHFQFVHHDVHVDDLNEGNGVCKIWDGGTQKLDKFVSH